ncbi:MAG: hypothetical protein PVI23_07590 [Maricaulaceae bacterium]|jgi:hypothetical protein
MQVVERTAMRIVVEHRAPGLAPIIAAAGLIGAIGLTVWYLLHPEGWLYLVGVAVCLVIALYALKLAHGIRMTIDAGQSVARWERTGVLRARREAPISEIGGVVLLPAAEEGVPLYDPVLKVGKRQWRLATRAVADAEPIRDAIREVLDLGKGRRAL